MDARGLPWGVQWEIARLITLGYCSWKDISMSALDCLRNEGLSTLNPDSPSPSPAPATVLNARIAPYVEDFFHRKKNSFGTQRRTKEVRATVRHIVSLPYQRHWHSLNQRPIGSLLLVALGGTRPGRRGVPAVRSEQLSRLYP